MSDDSILNSVKPKVNIEKEETAFDDDQLIDYINVVFFDLCQLGVGPDVPYRITSADNTWDEFLEGRTDLEPVKTYVAKKVLKMFDPPQSSAALQSLEDVIREMEWRLMFYASSTAPDAT
jgi:hypothetical protein